MRLQKEQQIETTKKKFNRNLRENAVEAVKPDINPQNMFNWAFLKRQKCGMRPHFNENWKQVDKKQQNELMICIFREQLILKPWKPLATKRNN